MNDGRARLNDVFRLLDIPGIKSDHLCLYVYYRKHHLGPDGAYMEDNTVIRDLEWSRRKLQMVRKVLLDLGLLRQKRNGPKPANYFPLPVPKEAQPTAHHLGKRGANGCASFSKEVQQEAQNSAPPYKNSGELSSPLPPTDANASPARGLVSIQQALSSYLENKRVEAVSG